MTTSTGPRVTTAPPPVKEGAVTPPTRSWLQKHRPLVISLALATVAMIIVAVVGMAMTRGNGDSVSTSSASPAAALQSEGVASPAKPATTSSDIRPEDSVPRDVGGEGVAPAVSAAPAAAPAAPQQTTTSESAPPVTSKGFASGTYKLSQITTSSSNVVVALFGAAREGNRTRATQYADLDTLDNDAFSGLIEILRRWDKEDWLLVGRLHYQSNKATPIDPKEAEPDTSYLVSTLYISPCGDGSCSSFWRVNFRLYKTPADGWRIGQLFLSSNQHGLWDQNAFERELANANNEPFNFRY